MEDIGRSHVLGSRARYATAVSSRRFLPALRPLVINGAIIIAKVTVATVLTLQTLFLSTPPARHPFCGRGPELGSQVPGMGERRAAVHEARAGPGCHPGQLGNSALRAGARDYYGAWPRRRTLVLLTILPELQ